VLGPLGLFAPRFAAISCEFARYDIARHENAEEADRSPELYSHLRDFHGHGSVGLIFDDRSL
jgi:hypothetical protein